MAEQEKTPLTLDAGDGSLDDFRKAVEAAAKGELETPVDDDNETGNTGNTDDTDGGNSDENNQETDEEKAAKEAAAKEAEAKAAAEAKKPKKSVSDRIAEFRRSLTEAQEIAQIEAGEAERLRLENEALKKETLGRDRGKGGGKRVGA
jgi:hypothetical protein